MQRVRLQYIYIYTVYIYTVIYSKVHQEPLTFFKQLLLSVKVLHSGQK